jgi:flagellar export protein FliJ
VSLKSIVDYRRHLQEIAREELLRMTQAFAAQLDATCRLEQELERILEKIAGSKRVAVPADDALALYRLAEGVSGDLATARRLAESLKAQKEVKQGSLLAAAQEYRIVEKLGARRDQEHLLAEDRKEQKSSDEGSLRRWQDLAETGRRGNFLPGKVGNGSSSVHRGRGRGGEKESGDGS